MGFAHPSYVPGSPCVGWVQREIFCTRTQTSSARNPSGPRYPSLNNPSCIPASTSPSNSFFTGAGKATVAS